MPYPVHMARTIEIGERFGRLVVLDLLWFTRPSGKRERAARCLCECGNEKTVPLSRLGRSAWSCGCLNRDNLVRRNKAGATHGMSGHRLYGTWERMVARCHSPHCKDYPSYGGRGIHVCDDWQADPRPFIEHVEQLLHYGEAGRSLDRIDNDRGYEPGNVRWATSAEQVRNSGKTVLSADDVLAIRRLYATGEYLQRDLAEKFDVNQTTISNVVLRKTWADLEP